MSNAPRSARSFEKIEQPDLVRLGEIAFEVLKRELDRQHGIAEMDECQLINICLCQGAAEHYLNYESRTSCGVNDFDVWAFFYPDEMQKIERFGNREPATADFGPSKFGRSPLDPKKFKGRRVDVFWRAIPEDGPALDPDGPVRAYFHGSKSATARELRKHPAVKVWPDFLAGGVMWNPRRFGAPGSYDPWA
jgi:hypothetical protein